MLSTPCPRCGRPAPLSLAAPAVLACPACRYTGATPPDVAANLHAAGRVLAQANVRERQLTFAQQRAMASSSSQNTTFFAIFAVSLLPASCAAMAGTALIVEEDAPDTVAKLVFFVLPLFVVLASGLAAFFWMKGRRAKLREAVTAVPPVTPGAPCACHVCGAPLVTGPAAMIRCAHCSADNLVSPGALEAIRSRRQVVLDGYEAHLRGELTSVGRAAARASAMAFFGSLLIPPVFLLAIVMIFFPIMMAERKPDLTMLYVHQRMHAGDCIGLATPLRRGGFKIDFTAAGDGDTQYQKVDKLEAPFDVTAMVGREIVVDGKKGTIRRVYANPILGNHTAIAMDDGSHRTDEPQRLCFTGPKALPPLSGEVAHDAGTSAAALDASHTLDASHANDAGHGHAPPR